MSFVGSFIDWVMGGVSTLTVTADVFEIETEPGVDMLFSSLDVLASLVSSAYQGETYWGVPYPDAPTMLVLGQDVAVSTADFTIGATFYVAGLALGELTEGISVYVAKAMKASFSGMSLGYDLGRIAGLIPSYGAIGIYIDEERIIHVAFLNYSPADDGTDPTHIGDNRLDDLLQGDDHDVE